MTLVADLKRKRLEQANGQDLDRYLAINELEILSDVIQDLETAKKSDDKNIHIDSAIAKMMPFFPK